MPKNFKEIKNKSVNELKTTLIENQELLRELNFKDANRQLKNVRQIRQIKKMIAQISTVLSQQKDNK